MFLLRTKLAELFRVIISELIGEGRLPSEVLAVPIEISDPKNPEHGDFACNFALVASKVAGMNPRELGQALADGLLAKYPSIISSVEVAGPGFINLRLHAVFVAGYVGTVLTDGFKLESASRTPNPLKINVEFVSVNPNGPITIGSGRGAAYGSTLCNILEAVGHTVHREYYINDGVSSTQMALFAESVKAIVEGRPVPDNGYKGDYVHEVASQVREEIAHPEESIKILEQMISDIEAGSKKWQGAFSNSSTFVEKQKKHLEIRKRLVLLESFQERATTTSTSDFQLLTEDGMIREQHNALMYFGVKYDTWFSEQSLHDTGMVAVEIDDMIGKGIADFSPTRAKLKLAKGFKIEDVLFETQTAKMEEEEDTNPEPNLDDLVPVLMPVAEPSMEGSLADADPLETALASELILAPEDGETLWLRSTKLGDDMDRVLRRRDGRLTYIASDVAYHKDKFNRPAGADKLITVLGPDHHGYIGRLTAVVAAMLMKKPEQGSPLTDEIDAKLYKDSGEKEACEAALAEAKAKLEVQIYQLVRFMKDGKPAPMRKRDGNIYALIDLMREIGTKLKPEASESEQLAAGKDVARFFYLMRSHDTTFDFDLDLAAKESDENPVFYVQYAHARICSILAKAQDLLPPVRTSPTPSASKGDSGLGTLDSDYQLLVHDREKGLIKKIVDLPDEVRRASDDYGVHRLATYGIELARAFHYFYDGCRVIQADQPELTAARLELCRATAKALKTTLGLLGVSAPEKM